MAYGGKKKMKEHTKREIKEACLIKGYKASFENGINKEDNLIFLILQSIKTNKIFKVSFERTFHAMNILNWVKQ